MVLGFTQRFVALATFIDWYPVRMWISLEALGTMAVVFASAVLNSGDIRVSGTLAAVRGAFAR
jgi:hypothetical protein